MAFTSGTAAPWWAAVLTSAEKFYVAPWVIGGGGPLRWFLRRGVFEQARKRAKKRQETVERTRRNVRY